MPDIDWKFIGISLILVWFAIMGLDYMGAIPWPSMQVRKCVTWAPMIAVGILWLFFGGKPKSESKD